MTFMHWIQAIWAVSMCCVFSQIYFVERRRRQLMSQSEELNKRSEELAAALAAITSAAISGTIKVFVKTEAEPDQTTPPTVH